MKILAVDYGKRRIGLAISDELGITTKPLPVIENNENVIKKIADIVNKEKVGLIIIGFPVWDKISPIVEEIKDFVKKIRRDIKLNIELVNEFYSTKEAIEKLHSIGKKYKQVKHKIDSYSACILLERYLEKHYVEKKTG